ncbi:MAG: hypothetical protein ACOX6E_11070, partial [Syntrophomonadaceae bacterium]
MKFNSANAIFHPERMNFIPKLLDKPKTLRDNVQHKSGKDVVSLLTSLPPFFVLNEHRKGSIL